MNVSDLHTMSINELQALRSFIDAAINNKVNSHAVEFQVGDLVTVNHKRVAGMQFKIIKVNRKKMKVKTVDNKYTYNVPFSLIQKS